MQCRYNNVYLNLYIRIYLIIYTRNTDRILIFMLKLQCEFRKIEGNYLVRKCYFSRNLFIDNIYIYMYK